MATAAIPGMQDATRNETDLPYLLEEVPRAIRQSLEGVERIATIVRAMKEFGHPVQKEMMAGLTSVRRDASGAIVVPDAPTDLDLLLKEVEAELERAEDRLRGRAHLDGSRAPATARQA
jgi:hypothetical protein